MGAFVWGEGAEERADLVPQCIDGARGGFAQQCLELGEELFDRVQVRRIGWQIEQCRVGGQNCFPDSSHFMTAEIVQDHDVAGLQRGCQEAARVGQKHRTVHRSVGDHGRDQPVVAQSAHEGCRFPVAVRNRSHATLTSGRAATAPGHVRRRPCFVDENQPLRVKSGLVCAPQPTRRLHVFPLLLAGV